MVNKKKQYKGKCKHCGKYGVVNKVVDVDGKNLIDSRICKFCGAGTPALS